MSSLPRRLIFFCLALLVSGATVFAVQHWLHAELANRQPDSAADAGPARPTAQVLVAKGDLPAGTFLRADMLRWQEWPRDTLDESYVVQDKGKLEDFVGTVVRSRLTSGEPITAGRVARSGDRGFMAGVLSPGSRAVTVNVTPSTGMAGFVSPGDRVDLLLTMVVQSDKDAPTRHMSETVLTNLKVLAMDQRISENNKDITVPKTATLEVTPKQAEMVAVASELGLLSLSLRSLADGETAEAARDSMVPTWDDEATHLVVKKETAVVPHRIQVVRGTESTELAIEPSGNAGPSIVSGPSSGGAASGGAETASGLLGAITGFLGK
jgi:pilus assembly protein CpaB